VNPGAVTTADVVYPPNSGIVNVQNYGATGNGITDDTQSIINAMNAAWNSEANVVYFPTGTYRITRTLYWRRSNGDWFAFLRFQGQNQSNTTIKLDNSAAGFGTQTATRNFMPAPPLPSVRPCSIPHPRFPAMVPAAVKRLLERCLRLDARYRKRQSGRGGNRLELFEYGRGPKRND